MGQRKRHHLVARFLLKRFAAKAEGDKSFIWRLSKDAPPKLLSTKDVAVQSNFYGTEEDGLEAALSDVEGRWAAMLRRIDAGEPLEPLADELWHMVYLMAYRASPIRSAFQSLGEQFIDHLHDNADDPRIKDGLVANFDLLFEAELLKMLGQFPPAFQALVWENRGALKQYAANDLASMDVGALMRGLMSGVKTHESFTSAPKRGHNRGVSKLLTQGESPGAVKPIAWMILADPNNSVILGDCPVVAVGGTSSVTGAPWKFGKDCRAYYMPISPRQVLVGLRYPEDPMLSIAALNTASAALSEASAFSSRDDDATRQWSELIGTRWMPLDDAEFNSIVNDVFEDFGKDRANENGE